MGLAVGDGVALAEGLAVGVGDGVALAEGEGVGEGVGDGVVTGNVNPPPPAKPPPPAPVFTTGAAEIVKVRIAGIAAEYFEVAAAFAVIVHEPVLVKVTEPEEIVQLPLAVKVTGEPEDDEAVIESGPGNV